MALALAAELDRRGAPPPAAIAVFSPFLDLTLSAGSLTANAKAELLLPVERFQETVDAYLAGSDAADPRASPLFAGFQKPPPVLLQVGAEEALRDDAARMADVLRAAGGDVRLELWPGAPHAWHFFAPVLTEARDALASAGGFLADALTSPMAASPAVNARIAPTARERAGKNGQALDTTARLR